jgi:hypothetical protein
MWRTGRGGDRRVKEPVWEMRRTGRGGSTIKEPEWEMWRTGARGRGDQRLFEKKSFFKKSKTSTKHCWNNTPVHYAQGSH